MTRKLSSTRNGRTPAPVGEEIAGHTGSAGEESPAGLANDSGGQSPDSTTRVDDSFRDIVRASARIQLDLADLALDRHEHIKRRCGGIEGACPACVARQALWAAQRQCATAMNAATRLCWRVDADTLDRFQVQANRPPKGAEWKPEAARMLLVLRSVLPTGIGDGPARLVAEQLVNTKGNLYTYPMVRLLAPTLSSHVCATLARNAERKWQQERFDTLVRQKRTPPHYRSDMPIPIPAQAVTVERLGTSYRVNFSLRSGKHVGGREYSWPLQAYDHHIKQILDGLCDDTLHMGQVSIEQDRLRSGRWYIKFSYTRLVVMQPATERAVGINRGITCFLAAYGSDGQTWIYDGYDIVAYLKQIQRRRQEYQRDAKVSQRWGHGRQRTLKPQLVLQGKADRWRQTKCQTIARAFAIWCKNQGYTKVYMEDFMGIRDGLPEKLQGGKPVWDLVQEWPYYQLGQRIVSSLEEFGIATDVSVNPDGITQTCRKCGARSPDHVKLATRKFVCASCDHKEHLDVNTAGNVLSRGTSGTAPAEGGEQENASLHARKKPGQRTARKPPRKSAEPGGIQPAGGE